MGETMSDENEKKPPQQPVENPIIKIEDDKVEIIEEQPEPEIIDEPDEELVTGKTYTNQKMGQLTQLFGLHPLVGFGLFAADWMLFGPEAVTLGLTMPITAAAGGLFGVASIFIQRYGFKDDWGLAVGKGLLLGVLTAIPSALPSVVPLLGGSLGVANLLLESGKKEK